MDSFTLALLLGGLRGPLVMFLWSTSEAQKSDKDLEDFDTKIEWIRRLQPEFDTVHMFQIWNKAYNISVMMASPANKYIAIMQALDYADNVDRERPGDINIISAISGVYGNKLGGTAVQERAFYDQQFRLETMTDAARRIAYPEEKQFRRLWTVPREVNGIKTVGVNFLDDRNQILSQFLSPQQDRPAGAKGEWNDGSPLQYLAQYEPFPYGIPPIAMGYDYAKRSQVALTVEGQKPLQLSAMVIDSQPALQLRSWGEAEAKRARILEAKAFDVSIPAVETVESDKALASVGVAQPAADRHALEAAIYSYGLSARLARDARKEYERHLGQKEYLNRFQTYASHLDDVENDGLISQADHDCLAAGNASGAEREKLLDSSRDSYARAVTESKRIVLKYYIEDPVQLVVARLSDKTPIRDLSDEQVNRIFPSALAAIGRLPQSQFDDDRTPYAQIIDRAEQRIRQIDQSRR